MVRETLAGALLGTCLALIGFLPAAWFAGREHRCGAVPDGDRHLHAGDDDGGADPLGRRQVGVDPAVVSAPFITTIVGSTGLILYFLIARTLLGI